MLYLKRFLIKCACSIIPVKEWRKKIREYYGLKKQPQINSFIEAKAKRNSVLSSPDSVHTIFLGSSQVMYAFRPEIYGQNAFNLGSNSQDLSSSWGIYNAVAERLSSLKTIYLGYSVFSPGYHLQKTSGSFICDLLSFLYGFDYDDYQIYPENIALYKKLNKYKLNPKRNDNGYLYPEAISLGDMTLEQRIKGHIRENKRNNEQNKYIKKIVCAASLAGHKLYVVIMPARKSYIEALPPKSELFADLYSLADKGINIIDFYNDNDFNDDDFHDFDHMNEQGATKFTEKLKQASQ
jgi:hypothetical protein